MKRAQMHGEMFIYLMTILVIGLLLYLGVGWIRGLIVQQEIVALTQFKNSLESDFETITYGSTKELALDVPSSVKRMCFVETGQKKDYDQLDLCKSGTADYDPLICNAWRDNSSSVLFSPALDIDIDIGVVSVDSTQGYLCYNTDGGRMVRIIITGMGTIVKVSNE
jgi:hypothetical protein